MVGVGRGGIPTRPPDGVELEEISRSPNMTSSQRKPMSRRKPKKANSNQTKPNRPLVEILGAGPKKQPGGWTRVVYACSVGEDDVCPQCAGQYSECACPCPTMDEMEYRCVQGTLYARPIKPAHQSKRRTRG